MTFVKRHKAAFAVAAVLVVLIFVVPAVGYIH
jgi:hypothetical protein